MALSHGTVFALSPRRVGSTYTYRHRRCKDAQVRDRTRIARCWKAVTARAASDLGEVVLGPRQAGPQIQWVQSYVTDDKIYCVYIAPDEANVREDAPEGRFPAQRV